MEMWLTLTFAGARSTELRAAEGTTLVFKEGSPTLGKLRSGAFGGQLNCCVSGLTQPVKSVKLLQANIQSHPKDKCKLKLLMFRGQLLGTSF